jgi:hypothetical protein
MRAAGMTTAAVPTQKTSRRVLDADAAKSSEMVRARSRLESVYGERSGEVGEHGGVWTVREEGEGGGARYSTRGRGDFTARAHHRT